MKKVSQAQEKICKHGEKLKGIIVCRCEHIVDGKHSLYGDKQTKLVTVFWCKKCEFITV